MADSTKKEQLAYDQAAEESAKAEEAAAKEKAPEAPAEETAAAPEAPPEPTVKIKLNPDYEGPTPVYVSVPEKLTGAEHREEITEAGVEVPESYADSFLSQPSVVLAEEAAK